MGLCEGDPEQGGKTGAASGGLGEGQTLVIRVAWLMVGGDGVNGAVAQGGGDGATVGFGSQRRGEFCVGTVIAQRGFVEIEIRGGSVAGDLQALGLGAADQVHRLGGGDMGEMHGAAGQAREADVAGHNDGFGDQRDAGQAEAGGEFAFGGRTTFRERGVFRVLHDQAAEGAGVGEHAAHELGAGDGAFAVGEGDGAGFAQQPELGHFFAAAAAGDGGVGQDGEAAGGVPPAAQEEDESRVVDGGCAVGQGGQGGDAAGGRGVRSGGDGFTVFEAWFAEGDAHIDQAGA
jgi:hypothetical protein